MTDINGMQIGWKPRKQTVVALSSAEFECIDLSECVKQLSRTRKLFRKFNSKQTQKREKSFQGTEIYTDSTSTASLAKSEKMPVKSRHIDVKALHIKEALHSGAVRLSYVSSCG